MRLRRCRLGGYGARALARAHHLLCRGVPPRGARPVKRVLLATLGNRSRDRLRLGCGAVLGAFDRGLVVLDRLARATGMCSRHEPDNGEAQGSASLRTGTAPIHNWQVRISAVPHTRARRTNAGAVSHPWRTAGNRTAIPVRGLPERSADLLALRPRQHLLQSRMRPGVAAHQATRGRPALPTHAQWSPQPCRARQGLPRPAKESDASGFTSSACQ